MQEELFHVSENESDIRIDCYLSGKLPDISRSYIQKLIKEKQVYVNDKSVKV